jgi:demethylmenaquinone methyltransferase/2-methoxy-6-polyprenyl-1,4-benzoquinol methylase
MGWVARVAPLGDVLEIAAGTGRVSQLIAPHASRLVLLDSSPSSLALAGEKLAQSAAYVGSVCLDVFDWRPPRRFDTVIFAAWLHHVPHAFLNAFWEIIEAATARDGRVMFDFAVDTPTAHVTQPPATPSDGYGKYHDPIRNVSVRDLNGHRWTVVHETWNAETLSERLGSLGWEVTVTGPGDDTFQWATACRRQ